MKTIRYIPNSELDQNSEDFKLLKKQAEESSDEDIEIESKVSYEDVDEVCRKKPLTQSLGILIFILFAMSACTKSYSIKTKDEYAPGNCKLFINLEKRVSIEELTELGNSIREDHSDYNRLFVFYYVPDNPKGDSASMAWAITHFTPEPEVEILEGKYY